MLELLKKELELSNNPHLNGCIKRIGKIINEDNITYNNLTIKEKMELYSLKLNQFYILVKIFNYLKSKKETLQLGLNLNEPFWIKSSKYFIEFGEKHLLNFKNKDLILSLVNNETLMKLINEPNLFNVYVIDFTLSQTEKNKLKGFYSQKDRVKIIKLLEKNKEYLDKSTISRIENYFINKEAKSPVHSYVYELLVINELRKITNLEKISNDNSNHFSNFDAVSTNANAQINFEISICNLRKMRSQKTKLDQLNKKHNATINHLNVYISPAGKLEAYDYSFNLNFDNNYNVVQDNEFQKLAELCKKHDYWLIDKDNSIIKNKLNKIEKINEDFLLKIEKLEDSNQKMTSQIINLKYELKQEKNNCLNFKQKFIETNKKLNNLIIKNEETLLDKLIDFFWKTK